MSNQKALRKTVADGRQLGPGLLAELRTVEKQVAGGMVDAVPPSQAAVRASVAEGKCPFCGAGPWKMLPVHTNKIHGVDKWQLRDMAGLSTNDPLCDPETLAKCREHGLRNPESHARATEAARGKRRRNHRTAAGRARNVANLKAWEAANPERARSAKFTASRSRSAESYAAQGAALRANWAARKTATT
jgi:hypothetical protein